MTRFEIRVEPTRLSRLVGFLDRFSGELRRKMRVALGETGSAATFLMREELELMRYKGELIRSVKPEFHGSLEVWIYPRAPHAIFVRMGTRPHAPPWAPVERWSKAHGLPPGAVWASIRRHGTSRFAERKYGTKANPFPERTARRPELERALLRAAQEAGVRLFAGAGIQ